MDSAETGGNGQPDGVLTPGVTYQLVGGGSPLASSGFTNERKPHRKGAHQQGSR